MLIAPKRVTPPRVFFAADHHVLSSTYTTSNVRSRVRFKMKLMSELLRPTTVGVTLCSSSPCSPEQTSSTSTSNASGPRYPSLHTH